MVPAEAWSAERIVDLALARDLIQTQFPNIVPVHAEPLGLGWDNTAYLVNGKWVFRFPRRQVAVPLLEREISLLPELSALSPLPIPNPEYVGRPSERFPWPFAGYRFLSGQTACRADLSEDQRAALSEPLAQFLATLHSFPVHRAVVLGAGGDEIGRLDVPARSVKARATLRELKNTGLLAAAQAQRLERVLDLCAGIVPRGAPVLLHGDLYARHLLLDDHGKPAGIIDWGDIHIGDRAVDVGLAFEFLPPVARERFRRAYGVLDDATWRLAHFRALYHAANILRYAHRVSDANLAREGMFALRNVADAT
jgi:aminoglycoside phosphotransferase (APT) family kinase protein